jgi:thiamine transport system permease protein
MDKGMGGFIQIKPFGRRNGGRLLVGLYLLLWAFPFAALFLSFFSLDGFLQTVHSSRVLAILGYTFLQASISTAVSFLVAILPAYYAGKHQNAVSGILNSTIFIPFFFPAVSAIIAFALVFSSNGLLHTLGINFDLMYSLKGVVIAHVFYNSPLFVRYIGSALRKIPKEIIEEASAAGASPLTLFFRIEWPLIAPSAGRAALLVFIYSFMSFVIVLSIGGVGFYTIEAEISSVMRSTLDFSYSLSLAILQFVIIGTVAVVLGKDAKYDLSEISSSDTKLALAPLFCTLIFVVFEYSLVLVGISSCFFDFYSMNMDFSGIQNIFSSAWSGLPIVQSIVNSIIVSTIGCIAAVLISFVLAKQKIGKLRLILFSTAGISSAFLSMGLLYSHILSGASAIILFAFGCILNAVPVSYMFLSPHVESFDRQLIETARICGAGHVSTFLRVELPILSAVIASSLLQVWMIIFGEFTIAYTMQIQDVFPLASITAFSLVSSHHMKEGVALSGVMTCIVVMLCIANGLIFKRMRKRERNGR